MVKRTLTKRRKQYYTQIWVYKERREELSKSMKGITQKIRTWNTEIKRIDKLQEKIKDIANGVKEFTGVTVKYSKHQVSANANFSRKLFYKYGIESGIRVLHLHEYIGIDYKGTKRTFLNRLKRDEELNENWQRFKTFMFQRSKK